MQILCSEVFYYHSGPAGRLTKYAEERKPGTVPQNLSRARNSLGSKVSLPVRGAVHRQGETHSRRLASRLRHLRRHRGVILSGVRKNVETTERAFVVLLYLCGPKAIG